MSDPVTAFIMFLGLLSTAAKQDGIVPPEPAAPPPPEPFHIPPPGDIGPPPPGFVPTPEQAPPEVVAPPLVVDVPPSPPAAPAVAPAEPAPAPMPPWPTPVVPSGLPPFPGPGWTADVPVSQAIADRATFWNPKLWDFPSKRIVRPFVIEQFGGRWLAFKAAWHPGNAGPQTFMATEAFRLASASPIAPSPVAPTPAPALPTVAPDAPPVPIAPVPPSPPVPVVPAPPVPTSPPGPVSPYPGTGAWNGNSSYVKRYQMALTWLSNKSGTPAWNPQGVDGKYGPLTQAAVKAFQGAHGLAQDGECGAQTAAALDAAMGLAPAPAPLPAPVIPPPVVQPSAPPSGPPPLVSPYPGTGAWQKNSAYIARYQNALSFLSATFGQPAWNPQGVDGKYGPSTQRAVKAFQASQSLPVDGQAGPTTAAALDHLLSTGSPS